MKKISLLALIIGATFMVSCKKEYTCECTSKVTWSEAGSSSTKEVTQKETFSEKMKEKQAKSACSTVGAQTKKHVEEQVKDAYATVDINPSITTDCAIK
ncbi:MAG: hypothetical protein K0S32_4072 [Bacteroidetes bacterium]|jgi:hypothetical protein|nr:hypothetical protein [Bacteroidota bacterium]